MFTHIGNGCLPGAGYGRPDPGEVTLQSVGKLHSAKRQ